MRYQNRNLILAIYFGAITLVTGCGDNNSGDLLLLDLPFNYTVGATSLEITTAGGPIYVSVGAYGGHFNPFSGDPIGDAKSNLQGYFVSDTTELSELPSSGGNGNGVCDTGEACGFWGGTMGEEISNRIPTFTSPIDATLVRVTLNAGPNAGYFGNVPHWEIELRLSNRFTLRIGHLGAIAPGLRDKILAATSIDTNTYIAPLGHVLTNGSIAVSAGEALAMPHVAAGALSGPHAGYYFAPWAQMEFNIIDHQEGADVCVYDLMDATTKSAIQSAMDNDMANATSPRFSPYMTTKWVWGAEGVLCPSYSPKPDDFSNLHTRFGGWTERPDPATTVDEQFAIVTIIKSASSYELSNYESGDIDHLAARTRPGGSFSWTMPDSTVVTPFLPVGEVLEETSDSLLIKWRDIGWTGPAYQRASFLLDSNGLKIKWGDFAADRSSTVTPSLSASDSCNDIDMICYDHTPRL